jgi:MFS family permease
MTAVAATDDRLARRNALILSAATALAGANATVIFATGAILGSMLAPSQALATLPVSVFVVGMATATLPVGLIARRYGRRAAFQFGTMCGALAGGIGCLATLGSSFALFCVATFFGGLYAAVAQSYRFAAADTATDGFKAKAISWTLTGGVLAGFLGPQLVQHTMDMWAPYTFAFTYLSQAAVAVVAFMVVSQVQIPHKPPTAQQRPGRPLSEIVVQPAFIAAAACGVVSYMLMNLVMTSAPLAMKLCGHDISDSNLAIQWHVVAMYGPGFFTGSLINRFGAPRVIVAGLLLTGLCGVVDLMGTGVWYFWIGLILLGVGWNFGFIGASALVAQTASPADRTRVQSLNDFLVFGTMAVGSFSSGQILTYYGWDMVNYVVFPFVFVALLALVWFASRQAAATAA